VNADPRSIRAADRAETPAVEADVALYAPSKRIFPQAVRGQYRTIKWIVLAVTLGIYYALPFVRWDRGPHAPNQAVLIDFTRERFYFFFIELWPQEIYYFTGLLVLAAMTLFLMNAFAGRIWCGYLCPQTVWTDLFYAIERLVEGDRRERLKKQNEGLTLRRAAEKVLKHSIWLMIAWWTGGAWVLYFTDAPTLVKQLATFQAPMVAYLWIAILTFTTYSLAGFMREQVCTYMCPWPRIQAALTDEHALNVTYRYDRGEPRGSLKANQQRQTQGLAAGDCIDCNQCVAVCPTGVDIRNGLQLDCIQCGLCIDACDAVMEKVGKPLRLIAYDTDINVKRRQCGQSEIFRPFRPRTFLYVGVIAVVGLVMLAALVMRNQIAISVMHERNPMFVTLKDGSIRNAYTVRLSNKALEPRTFVVSISGLDSPVLALAGQEPRSEAEVDIGPDQTTEIRLFVSAHVPQGGQQLPVRFAVRDSNSGEIASADNYFKGP
jgi:cytochrome c oxidase accessory protein FixG